MLVQGGKSRGQGNDTRDTGQVDDEIVVLGEQEGSNGHGNNTSIGDQYFIPAVGFK